MMVHEPEPTARTPVDVAVGVLIGPDGRFLMTSRPDGKVYAGFWEFPGGKLEAGETVEAALVRELDEELGVHATAVAPWRVELVDYPHARVRLHFCKVTAWDGAFEMREGQRCAWQLLGALTVAPVLPGALPALAWMADEAAARPPEPAQRPGVRDATPADAAAITALLSALGYPGTDDWLAGRIAALHSHADARVLVAVDRADAVLGVIALHFIPQLAVVGDFCRIAYLCVRADAQQRGIGRLLESATERLAVERRCDRIEVHSSSRRTAAHRFYARLGYVDAPAYFVKHLSSPTQ